MINGPYRIFPLFPLKGNFFGINIDIDFSYVIVMDKYGIFMDKDLSKGHISK